MKQPKTGYQFVELLFRKIEEIPNNWTKGNCLDLIELKHGHQFGGADFVKDTEGVKIIKIGNISTNETLETKNCDVIPKNKLEKFKEFLINPGDILMSLTGNIGRSVWVQHNSELLLQNYRVGKFLSRNPKKLINLYILYLLQSELFFKQYGFLANQQAQANLGKDEFKNIKFVYPKKIEEQEKIAGIIFNLDNLIFNYNESINLTKKLKKGLMINLFSKGIKHKKYKKVRSFFGKYDQIPFEWKWKPITEAFDSSSGSTPSRKRPEFFRGNIPWVSSTDLNRGIVNDTLEKITIEGMKSKRLKKYSKGVFLIAIYGLEAAGTRGKCGILGIESTINQACMAFENGDVTSEFIYNYYILNGEKVAFNFAQGTKQQNLSEKVLKFWNIPIPEPKEQEKIISILSEYDNKLSILRSRITKLKNLKKGLMQKLLTGEIRV